jgi:hypothetical protein
MRGYFCKTFAKRALRDTYARKHGGASKGAEVLRKEIPLPIAGEEGGSSCCTLYYLSALNGIDQRFEGALQPIVLSEIQQLCMHEFLT